MTRRRIARQWLITSGAIAQALGEVVANTTYLLAKALEEPKPPRKPAPPKVVEEGPWWQRTGLTRDAE